MTEISGRSICSVNSVSEVSIPKRICRKQSDCLLPPPCRKTVRHNISLQNCISVRIPTDAEKALHWLWESVKQKNQYAQYLLGKMLLFGKETDRDVETGIALLSASAEQGNVYAARLLQSYYSGRLRNPSVGMASVRLLSQLARMFTDRLRRSEDGQRAVIEKKLRQKIEEKKQAHGMKMG